jgi:WD40 repeat protein
LLFLFAVVPFGFVVKPDRCCQPFLACAIKRSLFSLLFPYLTLPGARDVFATCAYDGTIKVWSTLTKSTIATMHDDGGLNGAAVNAVYSLSWCPANSAAAAAATALVSESKNTGDDGGADDAETAAVNAAAAAAGDWRLLSSSSSGDVCVWDARHGTLLKRFKHHSASSVGSASALTPVFSFVRVALQVVRVLW